VSNLEFELWWAGGATVILTIQPHVDSRSGANQLYSFLTHDVGELVLQKKMVEMHEQN
jgi:hypothetical protein